MRNTHFNLLLNMIKTVVSPPTKWGDNLVYCNDSRLSVITAQWDIIISLAWDDVMIYWGYIQPNCAVFNHLYCSFLHYNVNMDISDLVRWLRILTSQYWTNVHQCSLWPQRVRPEGLDRSHVKVILTVSAVLDSEHFSLIQLIAPSSNTE